MKCMEGIICARMRIHLVIEMQTSKNTYTVLCTQSTHMMDQKKTDLSPIVTF